MSRFALIWHPVYFPSWKNRIFRCRPRQGRKYCSRPAILRENHRHFIDIANLGIRDRPVTSAKPCPFCSISPSRIIDEDDLAFAIRDGFPVSPGHTLIIPRRHVGSFFAISGQERSSLMWLLARARSALEREYTPAAYNIGINDGPAAGQTVNHLHIHLIPRYAGDRDDPRGGVRWVLPDKARYWP